MTVQPTTDQPTTEPPIPTGRRWSLGRLASPIVAHLTSQFRRPRGLLGPVAGRIMAARGSNVDRNLWLVDQLDLEPDHRILEIGPGPGVALEAAAAIVTTGNLVAIDHSSAMVHQARARNRDLVATGRLAVMAGRVEELPPGIGTFDRIYAMNVWHFWDDQEAVIRSLAARLNPGGRLALGYQPRHRGATAADADAGRRCLIDQFDAAGLVDVEGRELDIEPRAVCVIGTANRVEPVSRA